MGGRPQRHLVVQLLILGIILAMTPASYGFWPGEMQPTDPKLKKGETLVVNCSLPEVREDADEKDNQVARNFNSSHLYFKFLGTEYKNSTYVRILSDRAVQLVIENIRPVEDSGMLFCIAATHDNQRPPNIAVEWVRFFYTPSPAELQDCVVHDWKNMACSWTPDVQKEKKRIRIKVTVEVHWKLNDSDHWNLCPNHTNTLCVWPAEDFTVDAVYNMMFNISSTYDTIITNYTVDTAKKVKPRKVDDMKVIMSGSRSIQVLWKSPAPSRHLVYRVTYTSKWQRHPKVITVTEENVTLVEENVIVTLVDLVPSTRYNITVWCIPAVGGHWSDPVTANTQTSPDVPARPPTVISGSFSVRNLPLVKHCREVTLYWQELRPIEYQAPEKPVYEHHVTPVRGCNQRHLVTCNTAMGHITLEKTPWSAKFLIPVNCSVNVTVTARNNKGTSHQHPTPITISAESELSDGVHNLTVIAHNDTSIEITWSPPPPPSRPPGSAVRRSIYDTIVTYTVYWCRSKGDVCQEKMSWRSVTPGHTKDNLHMDTNFHQYRIAVSRNVRGVSSGMTWSTCIYEDIRSPPPSGLHVSETVSREHETLTVQWDSPMCSTHRGYIYAYLLQYWYVQDGRRHGETNVTVSSTLNTYTLTDLTGHVRHHVRMASLTARGVSIFSEPISDLVTGSWATLTVQIVLGVCGVLIVILCGCGIYAFIKNCRHCYERLLAKYRVERPTTDFTTQRSVSSQRPFVEDYQDCLDRFPNLEKQASVESGGADSGRGSLTTENGFRHLNRSTSGVSGHSDDVFTSQTPMANYVQVGLGRGPLHQPAIPLTQVGLPPGSGPLTDYSQLTMIPADAGSDTSDCGRSVPSSRRDASCLPRPQPSAKQSPVTGRGRGEGSPIADYVHVRSIPEPGANAQQTSLTDSDYRKVSAQSPAASPLSYVPHKFVDVGMGGNPQAEPQSLSGSMDDVGTLPEPDSHPERAAGVKGSVRPPSEATSDYVRTPPDTWDYIQPSMLPLLHGGPAETSTCVGDLHLIPGVVGTQTSLRGQPVVGKGSQHTLDEPHSDMEKIGGQTRGPSDNEQLYPCGTEPQVGLEYVRVPPWVSVTDHDCSGTADTQPHRVPDRSSPSEDNQSRSVVVPEDGRGRHHSQLPDVLPSTGYSTVCDVQGDTCVDIPGHSGQQTGTDCIDHQSLICTDGYRYDPHTDSDHGSREGGPLVAPHPESEGTDLEGGEMERLLPLDGGRKVRNKSGYVVISA